MNHKQHLTRAAASCSGISLKCSEKVLYRFIWTRGASYTSRSIARFAEIMTGSASQMLDRWSEEGCINQPMSINQEMMRLAAEPRL